MRAFSSAFRLILGRGWSAPDPAQVRTAVDGKVVVITGASSGIGEATARLLANAGAHLLLVARRAELLEELVRELGVGGARASSYPADLADLGAIEHLIDSILTDHPGGADIVINNAGKSIHRSLRDTGDRFHDVTRTNSVNYLGPVRLLMGLMPAMRARGSGQIVNVSTVGVDLPAAGWSVYTASKSAFETWLRCIAPEVRVDGIATTSIHFPLVHTSMSAPTYGRNPLGLTADDAAQVIARSLVSRRRLISPWWAKLAGHILLAAQGPNDAVSAALLRNFDGRRK